MKFVTLIILLLMLTVAPLITSATFVCLNPSPGGVSMNLFIIVITAFLGMLIPYILIIFLPVVILTPFVMHRVSSMHIFRIAPLRYLIPVFLGGGAITGALVTSLAAIITLNNGCKDPAADWLISGALAGAVTASLIAVTYKIQQSYKQKQTVSRKN